MFTIHKDLRGRTAASGGRQPTKAVGLSALLGTLIVTGVAVNASIILGDSSRRQRISAVASCSAVSQDADRLACFDNLARQPAPLPAKGGNPPALLHSL